MSTADDTSGNGVRASGAKPTGTAARSPVDPVSAGDDDAHVRLYGLLGEFATPNALVQAARAARERYKHVDAYAPYSVEGLAEAVGFTRNRVPLVALLGGLAGGAGVYFLQWYTAVIDYAINVGGRPAHSWPMFVPVTFEMTILGGALAAVLALLFGNGLPNLYHPIFNAPDFDLAMRNRFFLCLRSDDPAFERSQADALLAATRPIARSEVRR